MTHQNTPPTRRERRAHMPHMPRLPKTPVVTDMTTPRNTSTIAIKPARSCADLGACNARTPACHPDQCRSTCPVPQACEVPQNEPAARTDAAETDANGQWLGWLIALVSVLFFVILAASA